MNENVEEFSYGAIPCRNIDGQWQLLMVLDHHQNWGFPKGHLDPGEMPLECAARELAEETGLSLQKWLRSPLLITCYFTGVKKKQVGYFLCATTGDAKNHPPEILQVKWVSLEEALEIATFSQTKELIPSIDYALNQPTS